MKNSHPWQFAVNLGAYSRKVLILHLYLMSLALFQIECCGVASYQDWVKNEYYNCTTDNPSPLACSVPYSCCRKQDSITVSILIHVSVNLYLSKTP